MSAVSKDVLVSTFANPEDDEKGACADTLFSSQLAHTNMKRSYILDKSEAIKNLPRTKKLVLPI